MEITTDHVERHFVFHGLGTLVHCLCVPAPVIVEQSLLFYLGSFDPVAPSLLTASLVSSSAVFTQLLPS